MVSWANGYHHFTMSSLIARAVWLNLPPGAWQLSTAAPLQNPAAVVQKGPVKAAEWCTGWGMRVMQMKGYTKSVSVVIIMINNASIIGMIMHDPNFPENINHILIIPHRQSEGNGRAETLQHWFKLLTIKPSGREPSIPGCNIY